MIFVGYNTFNLITMSLINCFFVVVFSVSISSQTYTHIYISNYTTITTPREAWQFFDYFPGAIWTIQHSIDTLAFNDNWPRDLHDFAERRSQIPRTVIYVIYMTQRKDVDRYPGSSSTWSTWLSGKTFTDTQDHHLHDQHGLAERRSQIPRTIIYMIYMT